MKGYFKAKDSYKDLSDDESFRNISLHKHNALLRGESVYLETSPRLLNKDLSEYLEGSESGVKEEAKKSEPSDSWTKEELKEYMTDNSIAFNGGDTKSDLLDKISASKGDK